MSPYLVPPADGVIPLDDTPDESGRRRAYVLDRSSVVAINAAIAAGRPLLVRGEPGTGKSQLARAAARWMRRAFLFHSVDARTEPRDVLYTVDLVSRLAEAQIKGAAGALAHERLAVRNFVQPGVLWWAFNWETARAQAVISHAPLAPAPEGWSPEHGVVLLLDEIDKADTSVPNALLDALGDRRFDVMGCSEVIMKKATKPLVVITTNEERTLPDAFLRRCFVLHLGLEQKDETKIREALLRVGRAQFPACDHALLEEAATQIAKRRAQMSGQPVPAPGIAEYVDLIDAVTEQDLEAAERLALLREIAKFVLYKHSDPTNAQ